MKMPVINLRRTYLIARRDYLGYVKTWGFWISFFMPFIFGAMGFFFAAADIDISPTRYETVIDETGKHGQGIIALYNDEIRDEVDKALLKGMSLVLSDEQTKEMEAIVEKDGVEAGKAYVEEKFPGSTKSIKNPQSKMIFIDPPATDIPTLKSYVSGDKMLTIDGEETKLNGFLHIYEEGGVKAEYWSPNFNNPPVVSLANRYFRRKAQNDYLESAGLNREDYVALRDDALEVQSFDPTKIDTGSEDGQAVTQADRLPYFIAAILSGILWLTVFSGAYMLLTSMLEEKLNKLMEMMLASTRFSEIIFGKLLGVAALTITAMLPYILIGLASIFAIVVLGIGGPETSAAIQKTFTLKMVSFFFIFLVLGYVFYGAFFIALGALAESMQDAQTLTTPIMLVLTACISVSYTHLTLPTIYSV